MATLLLLEVNFIGKSWFSLAKRTLYKLMVLSAFSEKLQTEHLTDCLQRAFTVPFGQQGISLISASLFTPLLPSLYKWIRAAVSVCGDMDVG